MKALIVRIHCLTLLVLLFDGCSSSPNPSREDYKATLKDGMRVVPHAQELVAIFQGVPTGHFITHFGFSRKPVMWNTEIFFGGRYELVYQVYVQVDYERNRVTGVSGQPTFYLNEVSTIQKLPDGRFEITYKRDDHTFGEKEWEKVLAAHGDFSAIGYQLNTNSPLADFDVYVRTEMSAIGPIDP